MEEEVKENVEVSDNQSADAPEEVAAPEVAPEATPAE